MRGAISSVQASRAACSRPRRSRFAKRSHSRIHATCVEAIPRNAATPAFARPAPQPFREARSLPHSHVLRRSRLAKHGYSRIRVSRVAAISRSAATSVFARPAPQPFREAWPLPHSRVPRRSHLAKRSHSRIRATRAAAVSRSAATPVFARPALKPFREAQPLPHSRDLRRSHHAKRGHSRVRATRTAAISRGTPPAFARQARFCIRMSSAAKAPSRTAFKGYSGEERLSACSRAAKRASSQSRGEHILAKSTDSRRET